MIPPVAASRTRTLGAQKLAQAQALLEAHDLDAWLILVRESAERPDPILRFFFDLDFTWNTFVFVTRSTTTALVATFDAPDVVESGLFDDVRTYKEGPRAALLEILDGAKPRRIGINVSRDDALADGLTAGLRDYLDSVLEGTPYASRLVPAGAFVGHLRAVKLDEEVERIVRAIDMTEGIFDRVRDALSLGMKARDIGAIAHA